MALIINPCQGDPSASMRPNFSATILALRPAVCTARTRSVVYVELKSTALNVSEQLDTVSPTCVASGTIIEQL